MFGPQSVYSNFIQSPVKWFEANDCDANTTSVPPSSPSEEIANLVPFIKTLLQEGDYDNAVALADRHQDPSIREATFIPIISYNVEKGNIELASALLFEIKTTHLRDQYGAQVCNRSLNKGNIRMARSVYENITDRHLRQALLDAIIGYENQSNRVHHCTVAVSNLDDILGHTGTLEPNLPDSMEIRKELVKTFYFNNGFSETVNIVHKYPDDMADQLLVHLALTIRLEKGLKDEPAAVLTYVRSDKLRAELGHRLEMYTVLGEDYVPIDEILRTKGPVPIQPSALLDEPDLSQERVSKRRCL